MLEQRSAPPSKQQVTYINNHDTGSLQAHWPFGNDKQVEASLGGPRLHPDTPGLPCIF